MTKPKLLGLAVSTILLVTACAVPSLPTVSEPLQPGVTATSDLTVGPPADAPEPDQTALATTLTPHPPDRSPTPVAPVGDTPQAESPLVPLLGDPLPPQPTPDYLGELAQPLPPGVVEGVPPAVARSASGARLLYLNGTLHIWHVDQATDEDLGWPAVAIECPGLAPDGHTFYFSDEEGAKRVDLADPHDPELLLPHFRSDDNPARHRTFCVRDVSDDGQRLLFQARDQRWYQWGGLGMSNGVARVVESPVGPPGEPWHCPGAAAWGRDSTLLLSGYSAGTCNQFPGLFKTEWGAPLVPTPVLTATLPHDDGQIAQKAGAWQLTRSPDGQYVAFWFDQERIAEDAPYFEQALYVIDGAGQNPRQLARGIPSGGGPPAWSEDSSNLYYAVGLPFDSLEARPWQVRRVDIAEESDQVAAELLARQVLLIGPTRGDRLLLLTLTDDLTYAVRILDLETGELINGPAQVSVVGWLP